MCGRYVSPDQEAIVERWPKVRCGGGGEWKPSCNVAPTVQVPILVRARDGAMELRIARWGLIPPWWSQDAPPARTFNARSEEAAQKPTWRESLRAARGLMPARGWYEWRRNERALDAAGREGPQPFFLFSPGDPVIAFAGIWSLWERPGAAPVLSCALLTRKAAPGISSIHPRMPAVLKPEHHSRWLDPATPPDAVQALIADARQDLEAHPVSTRVNDARNDGPELMAPVQPPPIGLFRPDEV
ncbi:MAG: SOS response-associated peptidase [Kiritimatiellia bacterium]